MIIITIPKSLKIGEDKKKSNNNSNNNKNKKTNGESDIIIIKAVWIFHLNLNEKIYRGHYVYSLYRIIAAFFFPDPFHDGIMIPTEFIYLLSWIIQIFTCSFLVIHLRQFTRITYSICELYAYNGKLYFSEQKIYCISYWFCHEN